MVTELLSKKNTRVLLGAAMAAMLLPLNGFADEVSEQIEEVVVTGAVRGSDTTNVADIDLPGDDQLAEMPVVYE